jgi:hypothetical protein
VLVSAPARNEVLYIGMENTSGSGMLVSVGVMIIIGEFVYNSPTLASSNCIESKSNRQFSM